MRRFIAFELTFVPMCMGVGFLAQAYELTDPQFAGLGLVAGTCSMLSVWVSENKEG